MDDHPIQGLMVTAMENLREMVDVNKIVGDPVETPDGTTIIPICRVSFGFAAGGSQFNEGKASKDKDKENNGKKENGGSSYPFGGGSGGGVTVHPIAFLVAGNGQVRLLPADNNALYDRLLDTAPQLFEQLKNLMGRGKSNNDQQVKINTNPIQ